MDYTSIIKPLHGPTYMLKTSKISSQVEIASWAQVWQYKYALKRVPSVNERLSNFICYLTTGGFGVKRTSNIKTNKTPLIAFISEIESVRFKSAKNSV